MGVLLRRRMCAGNILLAEDITYGIQCARTVGGVGRWKYDL